MGLYFFVICICVSGNYFNYEMCKLMLKLMDLVMVLGLGFWGGFVGWFRFLRCLFEKLIYVGFWN